jgi:hypothetical protein
VYVVLLTALVVNPVRNARAFNVNEWSTTTVLPEAMTGSLSVGSDPFVV